MKFFRSITRTRVPSRRSVLALLLFSISSIAAPQTRSVELASRERPNVIFIRTDDQARWAVGFNGNTEIHTPNMDRIHREGASFSNAFVTTPVCSPSRVALMTGLRGIQVGVTDWIHRDDETRGLDPEAITWPEALHAAVPPRHLARGISLQPTWASRRSVWGWTRWRSIFGYRRAARRTVLVRRAPSILGRDGGRT